MHDKAGVRAEALFFDLDGVLWDSSLIHAQAYATVCEFEGLMSPPYVRLAGMTTSAAWELVLDFNGCFRPDSVRVARLTEMKRSIARAALRDNPPINPHIATIWQRSAIPLALVSGSSRETVSIFLDAVSELGSFDVVIAADDGGRGKPHPDPYVKAALQLACAPAVCWVLEDSESGLESAQSAGTSVVHYTTAVKCSRLHDEINGCVGSLPAFIELACGDSRQPEYGRC